jgi:hypothetical protein
MSKKGSPSAVLSRSGVNSPYCSSPGASAQRRRWAQSSCRDQGLGVDAASFIGVTNNAVSSYSEAWSASPTRGARPPSSMQPLRITVRGHGYVRLPLKR